MNTKTAPDMSGRQTRHDLARSLRERGAVAPSGAQLTNQTDKWSLKGVWLSGPTLAGTVDGRQSLWTLTPGGGPDGRQNRMSRAAELLAMVLHICCSVAT